MPPNKSNDKSEYKKTIKLELDKLKNGDIQNVKVDLTKVIRKLAKIIGVLSEDVYVPIQFKEILCFKWSNNPFVNER